MFEIVLKPTNANDIKTCCLTSLMHALMLNRIFIVVYVVSSCYVCVSCYVQSMQKKMQENNKTRK